MVPQSNKTPAIQFPTKPRLFIASSRESLDLAYAVQASLQYDVESVVWDQGVFALSSYTLEPLLEALRDFDFSAFVFSGDDLAVIRGQHERVVRDNVLFELGMFIGGLGKNRSFILVPHGQDAVHFPTDLLGITPATYEAHRTDNNIQAALGPACNEIRKSIRSLGSRKNAVADQYAPLLAFHETFRKVNWNSLLERAEKRIDIVVYYFDSWVKAYYDSIVNYFRKPGAQMRIFVADPNNPDILDNVHRLFPEYSKEFVSEKIAHTGERFVQALKDAGGQKDQFELFYVPHLLNYSIQCIDDSVMVLSVFEMFREMKIDSPAFVIDLEKSEHLKHYWEKELRGFLKIASKVALKF